MTRWGILGCGDVTELKSGPGFQKADGSSLVAVMRRDLSKARDYAGRHGVPRAYDRAGALIDDPEVDAVYIATPPSSHCELALAVAASGKPCLVEKPMAMNHGECRRMIDAFTARGLPLWVAYYRRALPRFIIVRDLLSANAIGRVTSVHVAVTKPLAPTITGVAGFPINTAGAYGAEDVTAAAFSFGSNVVGTGTWNFNAGSATDTMTFTGTEGVLETPVFSDSDVIVTRGKERQVHSVRYPPHVHQPLIQAIVDELAGVGRCPSNAESGARASWVLERCLLGITPA
jgi:1,5-anhydro-D-fructose reductase (1,5-anhydro-D-mannitol-forming)